MLAFIGVFLIVYLVLKPFVDRHDEAVNRANDPHSHIPDQQIREAIDHECADFSELWSKKK